MNAVQAMLNASWTERLGWTLLYSVWEIGILAAACSVGLALLKQRSPNARYVVACGALLLMLAAPAVTFVGLGGVDRVRAARAAGNRTEQRLESTTGHHLPARSEVQRTSSAEAETASTDTVSAEPSETPIVGSKSSASLPAGKTAEPRLAWTERVRRLLPWLSGGWLVGVSLLSLRPFLGWVTVRRLRRRGLAPPSSGLNDVARRVCNALQIRRPVRVLQSALIDVPTVVGHLKPLVLLPAAAVTGLTAEQLQAVLAHELAHVRRHDYFINLFQTVVEVLLFYHPCAWWISRRMRQERENCCDDVAIEFAASRVDYVRALTWLDEQRSMAGALAIGSNGGSLLFRSRRILQIPVVPSRRHGSVGWVVSFAPLAVVVSLLIAGHVSATTESGARSETADEAASAKEHTTEARRRWLAQARHSDWLVRAQSIDALAELEAPMAVQAFINALDDEHPKVRRAAVFALRRFPSAEAVPHLATALERASERFEVEHLIRALQEVRPRETVQAVLQAYAKHRSGVSTTVLDAYRDLEAPELNGILHEHLLLEDGPLDRTIAALLVARRDSRINDLLAEQLVSAPVEERHELADLLAQAGDGRALAPLLTALLRENEDVRRSAIRSLGELGDPQAVPAIIEVGSHADDWEGRRTREEAAEALAKIGGKQVLAAIGDWAGDAAIDWRYRTEFIEALGECKDPAAVDVLVSLANPGEDVQVLEEIVHTLGRIGDARALDTLERLANHTEDRVRRKAVPVYYDLRLGAIEALRNGDRNRAFELAASALSSDEEENVLAAIRALAELGHSRSLERLLPMVDDTRAAVRTEVVSSLAAFDDPRAGDALARLATEGDRSCRWEAAEILAYDVDPRAIEPLLEFTWDEHRVMRQNAAEELGRFDDPRVMRRLGEMLADPDYHVRKEAAEILARVGDASVLDDVLKALEKAEAAEQLQPLVTTLGRIRDPRAVAALEQQLASGETRGAAAEALARLGWQPMTETQRLRYLAATGRRVQVEAVVPPAEPVDRNRLAGEFRLDVPITAKMTVGTDEWPTVIGIGSIEFTQVDGRLIARILYSSYGNPASRWRVRSELLNGAGQTLGAAEGVIEVAGVMISVRMMMPIQSLRLDFGALNLEDVTRFELSVEQELQLVQAEARGIPDRTTVLSHVDNSAEGRRSIAASGHAVRFEGGNAGLFAEAIQIFATRYGTPKPPKDDFHVYLLNEEFQVLHKMAHPYATIPRGDLRWHTLRTPSIEVPEVFYVALAFNPHQTKGIYLGLDESLSDSHSWTGLVGDGFSKWEHASDWMVRVHVTDEPTGQQGLQRLADWKPAAPPEDPFQGTIEAKFDDGQSAGKQSYGGAGPVLTIPMNELLPEGIEPQDVRLAGVRVYGSRYGSGYNPETTMLTVNVLDNDAAPLWQEEAPYALFGYEERWIDIVFDEPVPVASWLRDDGTLLLSIDPQAHQRKGIYFHYSEGTEAMHSRGFVQGKRFFDVSDREWMIRAYFCVEE